MRICFVGHSAGNLLSPSAGGSERQLSLLARELATRGHDVRLVVAGLGGPDRVAEGVRIVSAWDPDEGVRWVRAVTHRYPRLFRKLREQNADVYYTRGGAFYTFVAVWAAKVQHALSVVAIASDGDLKPQSGRVLFFVGNDRVSRFVGPVLHAAFRRFALQAATWVVVQNRDQEATCAGMGLACARIPNIVPAPPTSMAALEPQRDVVWAGNVVNGRRSKGIGELAELASRLPDVRFTVIGTLSAKDAAESVELLASLPNVELAGQLSHRETLLRMALHRLVINTSPSEGFSNVVLEGWSLGRPCVTLSVDPNGLLEGDGLGICARGDLDVMAASIVALLTEDAAREAMAGRCLAYVAEMHSPDRIVAAFEGLVDVEAMR